VALGLARQAHQRQDEALEAPPGLAEVGQKVTVGEEPGQDVLLRGGAGQDLGRGLGRLLADEGQAVALLDGPGGVALVQYLAEGHVLLDLGQDDLALDQWPGRRRTRPAAGGVGGRGFAQEARRLDQEAHALLGVHRAAQADADPGQRQDLEDRAALADDIVKGAGPAAAAALGHGQGAPGLAQQQPGGLGRGEEVFRAAQVAGIAGQAAARRKPHRPQGVGVLGPDLGHCGGQLLGQAKAGRGGNLGQGEGEAVLLQPAEGGLGRAFRAQGPGHPDEQAFAFERTVALGVGLVAVEVEDQHGAAAAEAGQTRVQAGRLGRQDAVLDLADLAREEGQEGLAVEQPGQRIADRGLAQGEILQAELGHAPELGKLGLGGLEPDVFQHQHPEQLRPFCQRQKEPLLPGQPARLRGHCAAGCREVEAVGVESQESGHDLAQHGLEADEVRGGSRDGRPWGEGVAACISGRYPRKPWRTSGRAAGSRPRAGFFATAAGWCASTSRGRPGRKGYRPWPRGSRKARRGWAPGPGSLGGP